VPGYIRRTIEPPADLVQELAERFARMGAAFPAARPIHTHGVWCEATFEATAEAASYSRAAHLQGGTVPARVRFSNGLSGPDAADATPQPRGCAIAFLPSGERSDVVAVDVPGFFASTPEAFLAFLDASQGPDLPGFLASHPQAAAYLERSLTVAPPVSWLSVTYHAGHAVVLCGPGQARHPARLRLVPANGEARLDPDEAVARGHRYLADDLAARVAAGNATLRLVAQLASPTDPTHDIQRIWPDDRPLVELGTVTVTAIGGPTDDLAFDPSRPVKGIERSDDPLAPVRSAVYARSASRRGASTGSAG
jgi:catalase